MCNISILLNLYASSRECISNHGNVCVCGLCKILGRLFRNLCLGNPMLFVYVYLLRIYRRYNISILLFSCVSSRTCSINHRNVCVCGLCEILANPFRNMCLGNPMLFLFVYLLGIQILYNICVLSIPYASSRTCSTNRRLCVCAGLCEFSANLFSKSGFRNLMLFVYVYLFGMHIMYNISILLISRISSRECISNHWNVCVRAVPNFRPTGFAICVSEILCCLCIYPCKGYITCVIYVYSLFLCV